MYSDRIILRSHCGCPGKEEEDKQSHYGHSRDAADEGMLSLISQSRQSQTGLVPRIPLLISEVFWTQREDFHIGRQVDMFEGYDFGIQ